MSKLLLFDLCRLQSGMSAMDERLAELKVSAMWLMNVGVGEWWEEGVIDSRAEYEATDNGDEH